MSLIRLLQRKPDGEIVFREPTSGELPAYAILSHTWGEQEVIYQDLKKGKEKCKTVNKAGWRKIQFCAKQAAVDGLEYFWVDTCCIDKKNAVELGAAINSMFRWYQNAARCYVYLSDVSKPDNGVDDQREWEEAFRNSRWFTRGWTLQELISPRLVDFFSSEGGRLGSKLSLESKICEITGIANKALRGDALSDFSIKERRSWAEHRNTTIEEDEAYCLIGIFDVSIVPNYGERRDQAFRRLEDEIHRMYKGVDFEQFAVGLNLASFPEATQFVAREKELSKMHELLQDHSSRSCVILHGLGGMGKTQLAITYARRHKEKYTAIFWLNANDEDSLKLSFRDVAQQVLRHHPSNSVLSSVDQDKDLDQVVSVVKVWLDSPQNARWLMIYDNFDNPKTSGNPDNSAVDIRQFLPRSDHGSIIITTRSSQVRQGIRIHVQKLPDVREGLQIVSNMSGRKGIEKDPDAIALVKELDGLPLALSTAGVYLEHVTTSFSDYLQLYKTSWLKLQTTSPLLDSYEDRTLHTTWQITFDRIQQQNTASAKLLKLWAYFDRQDLWFDLLQHANSVDDEWIQKLTKDELNFNEAITLLCAFGLVDPDRSPQQQVGARGYSVHSCVHSWIVFVLNKEWDKSLARLALTCVALEVPDTNEKHWWLSQRRLLQHATRQAFFIVDAKVDVDGLYWGFHNLGDLYSDQSKLAEAEAMYLRALEGKEKALGPDHTSTLDTVNNLGILYSDQGKLAEAEAMYLRALEGCEKALGPDHTSTLLTVNNLGNLYSDQGKLAEAEAMYLRDGKVFGEASSEHAIEKFRGAKQITALDIFPLTYHPGEKNMRAHLTESGQKFLSMMNIHLGEYKGRAFYVEKERVVEIFIKSRVVVDAAYFREENPNYTRPSIKESDEDSGWIIINLDEASDKLSPSAKANGIDPSEVKGDDLLICSPTVPGFSLGNRRWAELAVTDIKEIDWKQAALDDLHIPPKKKKAVQALFEAHDKRATTNSFDDVVKGKGQGFSVLLHGPPGVGKTLTAELLAENLQKALMPVSAGELGTTAEAVEERLPRIFKRAFRWNVVLLLDEADVLLEQRSVQDIHRNALVCVFLRTLEYYPGMMFLTTNRVRQIDDAIASRIHFKLKYDNLNLNQRTSIWRGLLGKAVTPQGGPIYSRNDFESLVGKERNGREIKNLVSTAHALAIQEGCQVTMSHLEVAITACEDFECDFKGAGSTEALNSYF